MKPLRPRYKRIDQKVAELLGENKVVAPPVPVQEIADGLGAQVVYENFKGEISGLLLRRGNSIVIGVHKMQPHTRRRFTIAHEIGHLVMHSGALEPVHVDNQLIDLYARTHDQLPPKILSGLALPPENWLNEQLREIGESFQVTVVGNRWEIRRRVAAG